MLGQTGMLKVHRNIVWVVSVFLMVVFFLAIYAFKENAQLKQVRGLITDVQAISIVDVESVTVRDDQGKVWTFESENSLPFTPSHLREHMLKGDYVTISYIDDEGKLIVVYITD